MQFNSLEYLLFLPTVVILYYAIPFRFRWAILLVASYMFYMAWKPKYIVLIVFSTLVDYIVAIQLEKCKSKKVKKIYLSASLLTNLGMLFVFKYFNFFNGLASTFFSGVFHLNYPINGLNLLLPMGISFYSFQTLSYTIDVYRGNRKAERHLGYFALYVTYFPQLVAGPIERSDRLIPQLRSKKSLNYERTMEALLRIMWGFFKKVVIADRLAVVVNEVYGNLPSYKGVPLFVGALFFTIQIYCDFSGYSDIAIGSAKLMGHDLMENFDTPYFAESITEFWRRWHISLTTWFKDYLYIPLGGNRMKNQFLVYRNIFIVFLVSGLWHGANLTFVAWGVFHGLLQMIERAFKGKIKINIPKEIKTFITFMLVVAGFNFFRAKTIADAFYVFKNLFTYNLWTLFDGSLFKLGLDKKDFILGICVVIFLFTIEGMKYNMNRKTFIKSSYKKGLAAVALSIFIIIFGYYGKFNSSSFIYFQF